MSTRHGITKWSPEEDDTLQLYDHGWSTIEIAKLLGRSKYSTRNRIYQLSLSEEKRKERNAIRKRADRRADELRAVQIEFRRKPEIAPDHVLEERNRRYLIPRSLTALLMGDPVS